MKYRGHWWGPVTGLICASLLVRVWIELGILHCIQDDKSEPERPTFVRGHCMKQLIWLLGLLVNCAFFTNQAWAGPNCSAIANSDLRYACQGNCSAISDSDKRYYCSGNCSAMAGHDARYFCQNNCSAISNDDLRYYCSGSCGAIAQHDLRYACQGNCSAISNADWRYYCGSNRKWPFFSASQ